MPGEPEDDAGFWLRPAWETEDETDFEPPGRLRSRKAPSEPGYDHPLLDPPRPRPGRRGALASENRGGFGSGGGRSAHAAFLSRSFWMAAARAFLDPSLGSGIARSCRH